MSQEPPPNGTADAVSDDRTEQTQVTEVALGGDQNNTSEAPARERGQPKANGGTGGRGPNGSQRICGKCGEPLTGQFVRALGGTFHLECFKCRDCGEIVASKFFPVDEEDGSGQYPLCETDYFRRLDLLCFECGGALRGSYITALDRKYHIEHFTCSVCPTVFGAQDSYYEHEGKVYCHYHYSTQFAQKCNGCLTAILKQFVEIFRNGENQHWHPECYMIHKFWNVRLAASGHGADANPTPDPNASDEERDKIREEEERMEEKVYKIWSVLSTFEESSAACISDMLLHVSNGAYVDGVLVAKKFIWHVDILFGAIDRLAAYMSKEGVKDLAYGREAKLLCKKIVAFFSLLSKTQETGVRKLGVTQELLSLVTGLAHYLKLLIRIGLQGALKLERDRQNAEGLNQFLDELADLESVKESDQFLDLTTGVAGLEDQASDRCFSCNEPVEDACFRIGSRRWHIKPPHLACDHCHRDLTQDYQNARWSAKEKRVVCTTCVEQTGLSQVVESGFVHVTKLQQYVFLLRVALARLLSVLRSGGTLPHTSDDPNLTNYDSQEGHRITPTGDLEAPLLSNTRSKSYTGPRNDVPHEESSYEQTVGEMKRLRSQRNDKAVSTTFRRARASRIIDGPEGQRPSSTGPDSSRRKSAFQIVEDRDANGETRTELTFGNQDALTLDDIPRIVAAEQAKEQRPNAYRHAGQKLIGSRNSTHLPNLINGHQRTGSMGNDLDRALQGEQPNQRVKKYFSELSALEYFIVRHVAVLSMEPLLEGHFNLEELLGLIESRKQATFWGKFGKAFKNDGKKGAKKKGVFGIPLDALIERDGTESTYGVGPGALRIPTIVDDAISAMRQMDMSVEGVFRKNGNIRRLRELMESIDMKDENVDLTKESPVQIAALLKKFFRGLPDPLLTFKLHRLFIISSKISDDAKRRRVLHLTCCLLPKAHRDTLEVLTSFLNWVSSFSEVDEDTGSKMDVHNLATVITPNILFQNTKVAEVDESYQAIEAVAALIEYNESMAEVPEDLQSILTDSTLFNGSADITTKEILKRYGDIGKVQQTQVHVEAADSPSMRSKQGSGKSTTNQPVALRVDTDPSQENAWQKERSVRHVQAPGNPPFAAGNNGPNGPNTPPQNNYEFNGTSSPYGHQRAGSNDSRGSFGASPPRNQNYNRNSGWKQQQQSQSPVGVTGVH
ncbi:MAG: hypothetical protein M1834_004870 [Cirrosporium novae-zelandiae]|nr:MAG: hypothetical protein M1834_004870 [Cirrosporium novae-zelandiae]